MRSRPKLLTKISLHCKSGSRYYHQLKIGFMEQSTLLIHSKPVQNQFLLKIQTQEVLRRCARIVDTISPRFGAALQQIRIGNLLFVS